MGKVVCITKDGLLSIAGMLIEDLSLNHAQIDSLGNLYVRMLIEDPALSKVEWGRDGIVRCRAFWEANGESGLWTPPPPVPPRFLYTSYTASTQKLAKINPIDLSLVASLDCGSVGAWGLSREGNYFYGPAMYSPGPYTRLVVIQIDPLIFVRTIALDDPYDTFFYGLYLNQTHYHVLGSGGYILKYRRNDNVREAISESSEATKWLYYYNGFFFAIGPYSNNRLAILKTNYINNYSLYYDYRQTLYYYPKWAELTNGYIYILSALSLIKVNCGPTNPPGPMSIAQRITHNLPLLFKETTSAGGAYLLARDYIYVLYTDTSYRHYIQIYNAGNLALVQSKQFGSGNYIWLATDDDLYIYVLLENRTIYKISKNTLDVMQVTSLSSHIPNPPYYAQNNFILA